MNKLSARGGLVFGIAIGLATMPVANMIAPKPVKETVEPVELGLKLEKTDYAELREQLNLLHEEYKTSESNLTIKEKFMIAANAYQVDFDMLYAIACHETGNFTSELFVFNNNPGGITSGSGWASYNTQLEGILEMTRLLKYGYINQGLTTLETIGPVYCPDGTEQWIAEVGSLIGQYY